MPELMTLAAYARHAGVAASTISRQVARGKIPTVERDGERLIDPAAADRAREANNNRRRGHGGRPDRALRRKAIWKARRATGFAPEQAAMLDAIRAHWPGLLRRTILYLGGNEMEAARALAAVEELTEWLATSLHDEWSGVRDYRTVLEPWEPLDWSQEAAAFLHEFREGEPAWYESPEGEAITDGMMQAGKAAAP